MGGGGSAQKGESHAYTYLEKEEDTHKFWAQVPLFQCLPQDLHPQLTQASVNVTFESDAVIIRQGDAGNEFFVIKSGVASVSVDSKDVSILKAGDYFGEGSLLRNDPRAATITALSRIQALKITRENFQRLRLHDKLEFPRREKVKKRHMMMAAGAAGQAPQIAGANQHEADFSIRKLQSTAYDEQAGKNVPKSYLAAQWTGISEIFGEPLNLSALLLVPISQGVIYMKYSSGVIFLFNFIAIVPLASILGAATEALSAHTGQLLGGLLNATFGNAVELIMCIQAVKAGLVSVVQGNLLGSVLSNLLLVLGMSVIASGMVRKVQTFNAHGAAANMRCQLVASISVCLPTVFTNIQDNTEDDVLTISRICSAFMMLVYCLFLFFMLRTHADFFEDQGGEEESADGLSPTLSTILLAATTLLVFICSECLVESIEEVSVHYGLSKAFIGIILLPIVGNAAEHTTAVTCAYKGMMDLALGVAVGSATQISLFVVPVAVLFGWVFDVPMDLNFSVFAATCLMLTVFLVSLVLAHGETNWLDGAMLVTIYCTIAVQTLFIRDS